MQEILDHQHKNPQLIAPFHKGLLALLYLFTGAWMFYICSWAKRKWLYLVIFWYAWLSLANVFLTNELKIGFEFLEEFHNKNVLGAMTIFAGWGIYYLGSIIDFWWLKKR